MRNRLPDIEQMLKAAAASQVPPVADPSEKEASWGQLRAVLDTISDNTGAKPDQASDPHSGGGNLLMLVESVVLAGLTAATIWLQTVHYNPKAVLTQNIQAVGEEIPVPRQTKVSSDQEEANTYNGRINITDSVYTYFPVSGQLHKTPLQLPFQVIGNPVNKSGNYVSKDITATETTGLSADSSGNKHPLQTAVTRNYPAHFHRQTLVPTASGHPGQEKSNSIRQENTKVDAGILLNPTSLPADSDTLFADNQHSSGRPSAGSSTNIHIGKQTVKGAGWQLTAINRRPSLQLPSITPPSYPLYTPRTTNALIPVPGSISIRAMGTFDTGNTFGGGLMAEYTLPLGEHLLLRPFAGVQFLTGSSADFNFRYFKLNPPDTGAFIKADSGTTRYTVRNTANIVAGAQVVKEWRNWEISSGISLQYRAYQAGKDTTLILSTTPIPVNADVKGTPVFRKSMTPGQATLGWLAGIDYRITPLWRVGLQYNIRLLESGARGELNSPAPSYPGKHSISLHLRYYFRKKGR